MEYTQPKLEYFLKTEKKHLKNYPYTIYYIINIVNIVLRGNIQEIVKKETCSHGWFSNCNGNRELQPRNW